ncbi:hemerythrin domain-containing protein [Pendulispora albinea]|uniref:Hemerythrin domain-containing protein n=1 Tax=Pendulispora albinea TaxID=2741071 RepID=A0ABZ2M713_9BACT
MDDPYVAHETQLRQVHAYLLGLFAELPRAPAEELAAKTAFACRAMLWHHQAESTGLFPFLRRAGRLRSTDVSFLDACDREHDALHALCQRLLAKGEAPHLDPKGVFALASELGAQFELHAREEEMGLAPPRLRTMVTYEELVAFGREMEAKRPR